MVGSRYVFVNLIFFKGIWFYSVLKNDSIWVTLLTSTFVFIKLWEGKTTIKLGHVGPQHLFPSSLVTEHEFPMWDLNIPSPLLMWWQVSKQHSRHWGMSAKHTIEKAAGGHGHRSGRSQAPRDSVFHPVLSRLRSEWHKIGLLNTLITCSFGY